MAEHNELGKRGEDYAASYLQSIGMQIERRNWHYRQKEIDIIARDGEELVFVEVKTRRSEAAAADLVSDRKIEFLLTAAEAYIQRAGFNGNARMDLVILIEHRGEFQVEHIRDAFR
ncbi:MAG: YraN family protein [Bacteroidales bacterium]|nr:YraN family protein [Bacteroidales bacterium]